MNQKVESFEHDNLTDEEKKLAKQTGFILVGKTGRGKTTLLNALFNKVVGKVESSAESVTKVSCVYYYKLTNGIVITLIDTPGIADSERAENKNIDQIHLDGITKVISDANIHIKGILFLVNFQDKRFDADEQEALLNYNTLFPLKNFWKSLVVVYTHFYADPYADDDEEEMKVKRTISDSEIFEKIMEKVKDVSDVISYKDLKARYFNSYSEASNNKKKKSNERTREELELIFDELSKNTPLFCQIEIQHIKNHKWKENGKEYVGEVEIIGFFDLNKIPIKTRTNIIKQEEVKQKQYYPPPSYKYSVYNAARSEDGSIHYQRSEGTKSNSNFLRATGEGIFLGGLGAGLAFAGAVALSSPVSAPVVLAGAAVGLGIRALFGLFS